MTPGPQRLLARSAAAVAALAVVALAVAAVGVWRRSSDADVVLADPLLVYDPVAAGEPLPDGYRIGLARDQIAPVYRPQFTGPDLVQWPAESLVIGVAGSETAKAYPVTHLNSHEMVVDTLEGMPLLVSW